MEQLKAISKYFLSFRKSNWGIEDYPISVKYKKPEEKDPASRLIQMPWTVQIINWWQMSGYGHTKKEAYDDLRKKLADHFAKSGCLPRPGTKVPLQVASSVEIGRYEKTARGFFEKILDMNYDSCFISDETSLWDFHFKESNEIYFRKIKEIYDVDVSDIENGNLATIFRRLSK